MKKEIDWRQTRAIKVYKVRIQPSLSKYWYCSNVGEEFDCILIVKEMREGRPTPCFAVVENRGDKYVTPSIIRTIRPEDCLIVREHKELHTGLTEYRKSF